MLLLLRYAPAQRAAAGPPQHTYQFYQLPHIRRHEKCHQPRETASEWPEPPMCAEPTEPPTSLDHRETSRNPLYSRHQNVGRSSGGGSAEAPQLRSSAALPTRCDFGRCRSSTHATGSDSRHGSIPTPPARLRALARPRGAPPQPPSSRVAWWWPQAATAMCVAAEHLSQRCTARTYPNMPLCHLCTRLDLSLSTLLCFSCSA